MTSPGCCWVAELRLRTADAMAVSATCEVSLPENEQTGKRLPELETRVLGVSFQPSASVLFEGRFPRASLSCVPGQVPYLLGWFELATVIFI